MTPPRATYRLQLNSQFGFAAAAALAPYLQRLGITHVYTSPILKARPGSTHGYDIVAHDLLNPELGDAAQFDAMVAAFNAAELKILLDFVPNHMGVGGADNPLWLDVLEWGSDSAYAGWFDIDWEPYRGYLHEKLLVPVLGDQYGIELDAGKLVLKLDEATGELAVWAYDRHKLPICPLTYGEVLGDAHPTLERLGDEFGALREWRPQVVRRAANLKRQLAAAARDDAAVRGALARPSSASTAPTTMACGARSMTSSPSSTGVPRTFASPATTSTIGGSSTSTTSRASGSSFRKCSSTRTSSCSSCSATASSTDCESTTSTACSSRARISSGCVRRSLAPACPIATSSSRKSSRAARVLPESWPVDGTTGYEFAAAVLQALVDPASEAPLTRLYRELTDEREPFRRRRARRQAQDHAQRDGERGQRASARRGARRAAESADGRFHARPAAHGAARVDRGLRRVSNLRGCRRALHRDRSASTWATRSRRRGAAPRSSTPSVFAFFARLLTGKLVEAPRSGFSRVAVLRCAMKVQQLSGPVMAKGLEDTAFYRYNRFIALNEVGGEPQRIGAGVDELHATNVERARRWPHALSATATHDTKRGEDARARLAVLTELPAEWAEQVREWRRLLRGAMPSDAPPDANDEYYFYQSLLGAWPPELCDAPHARRAGAPRRSPSGCAARMTQSRARSEAALDLGSPRRALRDRGARRSWMRR